MVDGNDNLSDKQLKIFVLAFTASSGAKKIKDYPLGCS
jgi:hypothetical protein